MRIRIFTIIIFIFIAVTCVVLAYSPSNNKEAVQQTTTTKQVAIAPTTMVPETTTTTTVPVTTTTAPSQPAAPAPVQPPAAVNLDGTPTGVDPALYAAWTRVAVCEEGGWGTYGFPMYPNSLGINATNWYAAGGGSDLSIGAQIAVAERFRAQYGIGIPDQNGCAAW